MPHKDKEKCKEYSRKYYQENRENIKEYYKKHNQILEIKLKNKETRKVYRAENPEKIKEFKKRHREKYNKELQEYNKDYRARNIERIKKQNREHKKEYRKRPEIKVRQKKYLTKYYQEHRDRFRERSKRYREEHKEKLQNYYQKMVEEENTRRKQFGLPLVGEGFKNEMKLLFYVHKIFQNYEILTHHKKSLIDWRPRGLELDIYVPKLKLAFEYMGSQHYVFNEFFYKDIGEFESQQYRDRCKKRLCKLKGITLIRIKYNEKLSEELILSKLIELNTSSPSYTNY